MKQFKQIILDDQVTEDAVRLLKSDFISLYKEMGHDPDRAASLWHEIRVSPKGLRLRVSIKASAINGATSFIADIKEEARIRLKKKGIIDPELIDTTTNEEVVDQVTQSHQTEKEQIKKIKTNLTNKTMAKGEKANKVKELVDSGITDVNVIVEKAGVNKLYAKNLLKKFGVTETKAAKPAKVAKVKKVKEVIAEEA